MSNGSSESGGNSPPHTANVGQMDASERRSPAPSLQNDKAVCSSHVTSWLSWLRGASRETPKEPVKEGPAVEESKSVGDEIASNVTGETTPRAEEWVQKFIGDSSDGERRHSDGSGFPRDDERSDSRSDDDENPACDSEAGDRPDDPEYPSPSNGPAHPVPFRPRTSATAFLPSVPFLLFGILSIFMFSSHYDMSLG